MSIFINIYHLCYDFLYILVDNFYYPTHLWTVWCKIMMFYLELFVYLFHHLIVQIGSVVWNDPFWNPMSTYNLFFDESADHGLSKTCIWDDFYLFYEVIDDHKNESMPVRSFRGNWSDDVHAPHWEKPRRCHDMQLHWRHVNLISINLAFIAFLGILNAVTFQSWPIIISSHNLSGHSVSVNMCSTNSFTNLFDNFVYFWGIDAS